MAYRMVGGLALRERGDPSEPGILLWPGVGFGGAYFSGSAPLLPGRAVAVDPPGWGRSPARSSYSYAGLVRAAVEAIRVCRCRAMIGHSLGGDVALGVAVDPPQDLRAVVLVDGGYLEPSDRVRLGIPDGSDLAAMVAFMRDGESRFPDWQAARASIAAYLGTDQVTPAAEAAFRDGMIEVDGELREAVPPEQSAALFMPFMTDAVSAGARAAAVVVPTLLIAAGLPPEVRSIKQRAWEAFAARSPLIDLHVAEDWGHNPLLTHPDDCVALIEAWLSRRLRDIHP